MGRGKDWHKDALDIADVHRLTSVQREQVNTLNLDRIACALEIIAENGMFPPYAITGEAAEVLAERSRREAGGIDGSASDDDAVAASQNR